MGRMLDTFKLGEGRRVMPPGSKPLEETPVVDCVVDWEIGEEVPFIEVGGPNKKVELSPGLLKHTGQGTQQPPHRPAESVATVSDLDLGTTPPMKVALEPWPGTAAMAQAISAEIITYHQPDHPASKEYARLLDAMLVGMKPGEALVLLLLGVKQGVGTSTVIANLGVLAAQMRKLRVALVDANPAETMLGQQLGHAGAPGIAEVLSGTLALEQAIVKTGIAELHLVTAGAQQAALTGPALTWLMTCLRARYDLVLIDGPALGSTAAVALQIPHARGVYLVIPKKETAAADAAQLISRMGGRLCGLIRTYKD